MNPTESVRVALRALGTNKLRVSAANGSSTSSASDSDDGVGSGEASCQSAVGLPFFSGALNSGL